MVVQILQLHTVQPGMRLARAVYNPEGKFLFPPGDVITEATLQQLKQWGIERIAVNMTPEPAPLDAPDEPHEELREQVREYVAERFRLVNMDSPYMSAIFELTVERYCRTMLSKPGKLKLGNKPGPAFQTERPEPVNMNTLIAASQKIGTLPVVFHRLVEIINDPYASAADAAKIIATDPALSAKLLRLVNSPFYGLPNRIDTVSRAVVLVGTGQLVMLAMGATLVTAFKGMPVTLVSMQTFWSHSIACGVAARLLAQHARLANIESFFVAGLLHDIARLLIYTKLPNHALYLLTEARNRGIMVHSLEKDVLGFTHEELGAELLHSWRCPPELISRVAGHHSPLPPNATAEHAALPAANLLSQALGFGSSGELFLPPLEERIWECLAISPERLVGLCQNMDSMVRELRSMLSP